MSRPTDRNLLSAGVLLIVIVVALLLGASGLVSWGLVPPLAILLFGCWVLVLAEMELSSPQKYGYGAFTTFAWGLIMIAIGGAWFLFGFTFNFLYSLALILLVLAALAIATAIRKK